VPLAGAAWGAVARNDRGAGAASALGGALAWGALLLRDAAGGRLPALASSLGASLGVPASVLLLVTLLLPAALAWGAAVVAGEGMRLVGGSR
jgi:hypothetical protein